MSTRYPTCSKASSERSNPQAEASPREPVSRNASELDSASLRVVGSDDSSGDGEVCHQRRSDTCLHSSDSPGGWRQRTGKEKSRNLRDPIGLRMSVLNQEGSRWKSEESIVVEKRSNFRGAKGFYCKSATIEKMLVLDRMVRYTQKMHTWAWKLNPEAAMLQSNSTLLN